MFLPEIGVEFDVVEFDIVVLDDYKDAFLFDVVEFNLIVIDRRHCV